MSRVGSIIAMKRKENNWQKNIASVSINNVMLDELKNILGNESVVYHAK